MNNVSQFSRKNLDMSENDLQFDGKFIEKNNEVDESFSSTTSSIHLDFNQNFMKPKKQMGPTTKTIEDGDFSSKKYQQNNNNMNQRQGNHQSQNSINNQGKSYNK